MGYNTDFRGEFKFTQELTASQLNKIQSFLGADCRDHPKWESDLTHIDLELLDDFSGIKWDGMEKTYNMTRALNFIIHQMRKDIPNFNLEGKMLAQGEDIDDRYEIIIKNGIAVKVDIVSVGIKISCPHCEEMFYLNE